MSVPTDAMTEMFDPTTQASMPTDAMPEMEAMEPEEDLSAGPGPEPLDDDEISAIIEEELTNTLGGDTDDELSENWTKAMDYFLGRPRGDEKPGRSKLVSMDLADTVEQTVAQMMPAFEDTSLAEFEPLGKDDEEQAQQESDAMNYLVMRKNNGWVNIQSGMLQRIGVMKVYVDECVTVSAGEQNNVSQFDLPQLLQQAEQSEDEIEVLEAEMLQDAVFAEDGMGGQMMSTPAMFNIKYKQVRRRKKLKIEAVPPEEIRINADHGSPFLDDVRFLSHSRPVKR
jgi:hypothetical protein